MHQQVAVCRIPCYPACPVLGLGLKCQPLTRTAWATLFSRSGARPSRGVIDPGYLVQTNPVGEVLLVLHPTDFTEDIGIHVQLAFVHTRHVT